MLLYFPYQLTKLGHLKGNLIQNVANFMINIVSYIGLFIVILTFTLFIYMSLLKIKLI